MSEFLRRAPQRNSAFRINIQHAEFNQQQSEGGVGTTNLALTHFDLIIVDEVSMVSLEIFHHFLYTLASLPRRPLVIFSGDKAQKQPIATVGNRIMQVPSIFDDPNLASVATI